MANDSKPLDKTPRINVLMLIGEGPLESKYKETFASYNEV
jgi:hypothetical protein